MEGMRKARPAQSNPVEQLNLIELPVAKRRDDAVRRRAATMTARHCNALLAELERIAGEQRGRAEHLTQLFEAAERVHARDDRHASASPTVGRR